MEEYVYSKKEYIIEWETIVRLYCGMYIWMRLLTKGEDDNYWEKGRAKCI